MFITNSFSLQMLKAPSAVIYTAPMTLAEIKKIGDAGNLISAIGHADTAAVVAGELGVAIAANRVSIQMEDGEALIVAQFTGGRLPEGATTLPPGISLSYLKVRVIYG